MKRKIIVTLCIAALIFLTACTGNSTNTKQTVSGDSTSGETTAPELTGQADQTNSQDTATGEKSMYGDFTLPVPGIRPYAVMIDNEGTRSLPQGGLNLAQVIYEIIVEGGETRLMPVFWGTNPTMIGSVRSSRHYFLDYAMENDAIYVHYGWSPMAKNDIRKYGINNINGVSNGGEIFWDLTKDRRNWQDSYTSTAKISAYVKKVKYRTTTDKQPVFSYNSSVVEPAGGKAVNKITIRYSSTYTCGFQYDSNSGRYLRFRKGKPQMERVTGKQLTAENILIQFAQNHTIKGDKSGRQEVKTVGSGKGYYITQGKIIGIKWSKSSRSAATKYMDEKGSAITLNPGPTWVQIVPASGKVTTE